MDYANLLRILGDRQRKTGFEVFCDGFASFFQGATADHIETEYHRFLRTGEMPTPMQQYLEQMSSLVRPVPYPDCLFNGA